MKVKRVRTIPSLAGLLVPTTKHDRLPIGVHASRAAGYRFESCRLHSFEFGGVAQWQSSVKSLVKPSSVVFIQIFPTAVLEYMVHNPEVAGSSPAGARFQVRMRCGAKAARRNVPNTQLRRDINTHSTAGAEYMALQVRIPPGPLFTNCGAGPRLLPVSNESGNFSAHNFVECP